MPPGNTGKSRSNPDIDLNHFRSMVLCLDDLWLREKGTHLGHNFLEDLPDDDEDQAKGRIVGALGDAGLLFCSTLPSAD